MRSGTRSRENTLGRVFLAIARGRTVLDERDRRRFERDLLQRKARAAAADGGEDASPVRIAAVQRGLDERRRGDRVRRQLGIALRLRAGDFDLHHARRAFAIAHDHPGELAADRVERAFEIGEIGVCGVAEFSGRHDQDGVVGRRVAVDGDRVEALIDGDFSEPLQRRSVDVGVGHDERQHRGHVRMNHARRPWPRRRAGRACRRGGTSPARPSGRRRW